MRSPYSPSLPPVQIQVPLAQCSTKLRNVVLNLVLSAHHAAEIQYHLLFLLRAQQYKKPVLSWPKHTHIAVIVVVLRGDHRAVLTVRHPARIDLRVRLYQEARSQ
eukprot:601576-Rhodomonas_salina.1